MSRLYGVDGNWCLHRIVHTQSFEPKDEALSQASRLLALICKDAAAVGARRLAVAFDGPQVFRYKLYEGYKGNRDKAKAEKTGPGADPYRNLGAIIGYLRSVGIYVVQPKIYEADDVLSTWAFSEPDFVGGTKDKDGYQWVADGQAFMYDSTAKPPRKIRAADVLEAFGIGPGLCVDYQTLVGDRIDNIPNLMDRDVARKGLLKHKSIRAWAASDSHIRLWCKKNVDALNLNRKLVRLVPNVPGVGPVPDIEWSSDQKITSAYHEFRSIATRKTRSLF